jgi:hypothetical protein
VVANRKAEENEADYQSSEDQEYLHANIAAGIGNNGGRRR